MRSLLIFLLLQAPLVFAQSRSAEAEQAFAAATKQHEQGDLEGAIKGYQSVLRQFPNSVDVMSNLGAAFAGLGRYEDAIAQYKRALAIAGDNPTIRFNLALAYYKAALFAEAAQELGALFPQQSSDRVALLYGDCLVRLGEFKKAIGLLEPLEQSMGDDRTYAYVLGSALISDGQVSKGQVLIDRVFRGEDVAEARLLIGSILLLADDGHGAVKEFERALQLAPQTPGLQAWYGRALMRVGDGDRAQSAFRTELKSNPNDFDANLYLGILLKRDRINDEALKYLSRAAQLRPRDAYARYHLGATYLNLGKVQEALPLLTDVANEQPEFIENRVLLAAAYYKLNRKSDGDRESAEVARLQAAQQAKPASEQSRIRPKTN
jgi:protein O-GlcNAc transferase